MLPVFRLLRLLSESRPNLERGKGDHEAMVEEADHQEEHAEINLLTAYAHFEKLLSDRKRLQTNSNSEGNGL